MRGAWEELEKVADVRTKARVYSDMRYELRNAGDLYMQKYK